MNSLLFYLHKIKFIFQSKFIKIYVFVIASLFFQHFSINHHLKLQPFSTGSSYIIYDNYVKIDTNVIVVPHGVFKQWEEYIAKFTKLKFYSINTFQHLMKVIEIQT